MVLNMYCEKRPQFDVETFILQLLDFGTGIDFAQQCSFLMTSSLDSFLPNCMATACIISGQWKSAADKVRNHIGNT